MANRTTKGTRTVHGQDPQLLVEKIIRERIYESVYWKEECFGLNAETILDKAVDITFVGGTFANQRPTPFLCLLLKLLQIQPTAAIIEEYITQEDFKYLRVLGLLYLRMVAPAITVYRKLEAFLMDRRKLRLRLSSGTFTLTHVDKVVDDLLTSDRVFDIILPRLTKRSVLEDNDELESRPLFFSIEDDTTNDNLKVLLCPSFPELVQETPQTEEVFPPALDYKDRESLTVQETNELRKKLGLAPLST